MIRENARGLGKTLPFALLAVLFLLSALVCQQANAREIFLSDFLGTPNAQQARLASNPPFTTVVDPADFGGFGVGRPRRHRDLREYGPHSVLRHRCL